MHYNYDLEIAANVSENNKAQLVCPISYGIIRKVGIYFRGGCADLAHVQIFRFEHQLFPTNVGESYAYDNYAIEFEEYYPIIDSPFELIVRGWNEDDTFSHTISFMFLVLIPETIGKSELKPTELSELEALLGEYNQNGG